MKIEQVAAPNRLAAESLVGTVQESSRLVYGLRVSGTRAPKSMAHALAEVSSFVAANVRNLSVDEFLRPLNQRIAELARLASEDDEQEALRPKSLEGFCRFLSLHGERIESRPQLVLTLDGYLRAVWRKGKGHRIALRFINDKRLAFVTFLPDSFRPTQTNHIGGESSIEAVFDTIGQKAV